MDKELLVIHANCQGEPLAEFLRSVPEIGQRYEIRLVINYLREPLPEAWLSSCSLFIYQYLGPHWNELSTESVLARLPSSTQTLAIPSMFFPAYWPFWVEQSEIEYPDSLLDELIAKKLPPAEIKRIYIHSGVVPAYDFQAIFEAYLERERAKEQFTPIHHVDEMLSKHKSEMVFNTVNHPGHGMLCWLGRRVLEELGVDEPDQGIGALMPALHPEFRQPVHPLVAETCGFAFAGPEVRYPVYGRQLTFEEYVVEYVLARVNGFDEFISFLRARAVQ